LADSFSSLKLGKKAVVLRQTTLGRIPPALYSTQLLSETGIPLIVVEFGENTTTTSRKQTPYPRVRLSSLFSPILPQKFRPTIVFAETLFALFAASLWSGRPNLLIAHGLQEQTIALFLWWLLKVPFAIHAHEPFEKQELSRFNRFLFLFESAALRSAKLTVFPEATRRTLALRQYALEYPATLAFNCPRKRPRTPPRNFRAELGLSDGSFLLGYLGGIGALNAPDLAIQTLPQFPRLHFLLAGWGEEAYLRSLQTLAKRLGVSERVHFFGVLDEEKWEWLAGLDAAYCVYRPLNLRARHQASASNKLFEAMAAAVPVIVGPGDDFKQLLSDAPFGIQMKNLSSEDLAKAIEALTSNRDYARALGEKGFALHQNTHHYENHFSQTLEQFHRLLSL
jgi:glycosyltransferase involved in cell wall biosynthesis